MTPWYHHTTIYQIYPRSFYDSNGDGIGDIQGIIQKLDYIQSLGFDTIWCSPFFVSPQQDFGYDISDYKSIAPEHGTMHDTEQLINEVHKRRMKIVLDMVMNHTSIEHPWFQKEKDTIPKSDSVSDYYIWRNKPNNWKSMTGGSGWHYNKQNGQYYWASFLPFEPDLNYRNPEVKRTMLDIVRFWLGKGVDGFRLDIFNVIFKDANFTDNPFSLLAIPGEKNPSGLFQKAKYTINQPESIEFAKELRKVCDEFGEKILLGEVFGERKEFRKFLGEAKNDGLGLVFDFEMLRFKFTAEYFYELISELEKNYPSPFMPVYVFSNHDRRRSIKRLGNDVKKAKLLHLLQLTLRGVPCMYQGEEIGMTDAKLSRVAALDPLARKYKFVPRLVFDAIGETINRDEVRTPMQWSDSKNAGFSSADKTWLPVHTDFAKVNVDNELQDENSLLRTVQKILKLRKETPAIHSGSLGLISKAFPKEVLAYKRKFEKEEVWMLLNFGKQEKKFPLEGNWLQIFGLCEEDNLTGGKICLNTFGGIILKKINT